MDVLLDVGCGIRPQTLAIGRFHVCCEPFPEYASHLQAAIRSRSVRGDLVLQLSWADVLRSFPDKSVDTVFLLDVIEHLEKEEGARLLRDTERIARRQIVLFTPLGFMPQHCAGSTDGWGLGGAEVQEHLSGWSPDDFDGAWEIVGCRDFHTIDGAGKPLERPFGAFFAIREIAPPSEETERERHLKRIVAEANAFQDPAVLARALSLVRTARNVNRPGMIRPAQLALEVTLGLRDSWVGRLTHRVLLKLGSRP